MSQYFSCSLRCSFVLHSLSQCSGGAFAMWVDRPGQRIWLPSGVKHSGVENILFQDIGRRHISIFGSKQLQGVEQSHAPDTSARTVEVTANIGKLPKGSPVSILLRLRTQQDTIYCILHESHKTACWSIQKDTSTPICQGKQIHLKTCTKVVPYRAYR